MRRWLVGALALAALVGVATGGPARAESGAPPPAPSPPACADGASKQRAHETGRRQGAQLVASAWAAVARECSSLAHVEEVVKDAIARHQPPAGASDVVKCRGTGVEQGASDELARLAAQCRQN